jgi:hypothetical protein
MTLAPARLTLFGEPQLLEGEDAAAYDELLARIRAAVRPVDIVEEMFIFDVVALEWEVLRWRRLKLGLISARQFEALEEFLETNLDYDLYWADYLTQLTEVLQANLPKAQEKDAQTLAFQCAQNEPNAVDRVTKLLTGDRNLDGFLDDVRAEKAEELTKAYRQRDSDATRVVNQCLASAGISMDSLVAEALKEQLGYIERIDHLNTVAENRRNAALREIDRHRAVLGEAVRRTLQDVEGDFKVIETTPGKGKSAA